MAGMTVSYVAGYLIEERRIIIIMACNYCFPRHTSSITTIKKSAEVIHIHIKEVGR